LNTIGLFYKKGTTGKTEWREAIKNKRCGNIEDFLNCGYSGLFEGYKKDTYSFLSEGWRKAGVPDGYLPDAHFPLSERRSPSVRDRHTPPAAKLSGKLTAQKRHILHLPSRTDCPVYI